ncbi:MAG: hypothetical protein UX62_C0039G0002 [Microgenomates group bacterium GW2011_GWA2_46_7]|nr:MAG: hypothetical protein UX62_C0039G0002 [Microgenomates group bacterium GW2011_GWA2_46_7]
MNDTKANIIRKEVFMLKTLVNLLIFPLIPLISVITLVVKGQWLLIGLGALFVIGTVYALGLLYGLERKIVRSMSVRTASYLVPVYYLALVYVSVILSWTLINSRYSGDWWVFLFAYTCCYYPYNYLLGAELAKTGRTNLMTNVVNNYALYGYLLFAILRKVYILSQKFFPKKNINTYEHQTHLVVDVTS